MKRKYRINQIISGIDVLLLGFCTLLITLGLILLPEEGGALKSPWFGTFHFNTISFQSIPGNILFSIFMAMIPVCAVEGSIANIRQGLKMRSRKVKEYKSIWARLGTLDFYLDIINNLLFLLIFLALSVITFHGFYFLAKEVTYRFVIFAVTILAYLVVRKWLRRGAASLGKSMQKGNPTYSLTEDAVAIRLVKMMDKSRPEPLPVLIRFDEIDELNVFTYKEAEAYLKYQLGPDVTKGVSQTRDFISYVRGEIPRPSVYTYSRTGTADNKRVLIRGANLFYLISFDKEDITDLLEAFYAYKNLDDNPPKTY